MQRTLVVALLLLLFVFAGCKNDKPTGPERPVVVSSIFPLHDLVRRIGGDAIETKLLLEPGRSEHNYVGTAKDAKVVSRAKLAFLVGLGLDEWTEKIVTSSGGSAQIIELGEIVGAKMIPLPRFEEEHHEGEKPEPGEEEEHHHDHSGLDPHLWLSIPKVKLMAAEIEKSLAAALPAEKEKLAANRARLDGELDGLNEEIKKKLGSMANKTIVTFHGSFGYFAESYGLTIAAVVEPSPGKEPSAAYMRKILSAVSARKPLAVFTEPQLDPKPAEVLGKEGSLQVRMLDPIGGVSGRDTYEALMRFNADSLAAPMTEEQILVVDSLSVSFGDRKVFHDVSFHVCRGEFCCLLGPNGAGKSTLLKTLLGFVEPTAGKVSVLGLAPGKAGKRVGYVPQLKSFDRSFPASVLELIVANLRGTWPVRITPAEREKGLKALARVRGEKLLDLPLAGLSGGETQRAFLARALVTDPELIFLDEPATGVDAAGREDLYDLLHAISCDQHVGAVMVTHSPAAIERTAEKIVLIDGTVRACGHPKDLLADGKLFAMMGLGKSKAPGAVPEEG